MPGNRLLIEHANRNGREGFRPGLLVTDSTDTTDMANGPPFPANPLCTLWLRAAHVDRLTRLCDEILS